ncbi:MAG: methyltransferase domain-containing protein [Opitutales bacterium]|nr:methyltransferase domain-containing protein [Opitutales bacterium]
MFTDSIKFICKFLANPKTTGALCPSSCFLARQMAANCPESGLIIELGAGSGSVTSEILKKAQVSRVRSVELDKNLCGILKNKFPNLQVVNDSAENIAEIANNEKIGAVISSLPLLNIPEPVVRNILNAVESTLPKGGIFVQFTYNLRKKPEQLGFTKMRHLKTKFVYLNIPPARVDVFVKE